MANTTCTKPPAGWHCTLAEGHEGPCAASPKPEWPQLEKIIDAHVDGYELHGENAAGFDVRYDPTEHERFLIRDAIAGLFADPDWAAAWGRHVNEIVAARNAEQQPLFWYRPCRGGLYEGPHHTNSAEGKLLRAEKSSEWKPLYTAPSVPCAPAAVEANEQRAKCPDCNGSGVDGDVDDYGRTIDIACGACDGTGRACNGRQAAIERVARVFQKSVIGIVPADYATGYTEALEHVRRALASSPSSAPAKSDT
ncbi:hypothetical protein FHT32_004790 [Variovorax sp. SG517]|uniref:hypothetical protein n=1 Tax=Variovorax sp. SG517 TaxID=2587117 RepID=UPI00159D0EA1|nr:hypothetical protein [Variovorax sp. SG517]NVM91126.1 hypothetical protein [Variovorax sp. SG517]